MKFTLEKEVISQETIIQNLKKQLLVILPSNNFNFSKEIERKSKAGKIENGTRNFGQKRRPE